MDVTFRIDKTCPSGGHIWITVTIGQKSRQILIDEADLRLSDILKLSDDELSKCVGLLLRVYIKGLGLTNPAQIKSAIEEKVFQI